MRLAYQLIVAIPLCILFWIFIVFCQLSILMDQANELCTDPVAKECIEKLIQVSKWEMPYFNHAETAGKSAFVKIKASNLSQEEKRLLLMSLRSARYGSRNFLRPENSEKRSLLLVEIDKELAFDPSKKIVSKKELEPDYYMQMLSNLFFWAWIAMTIGTIWYGFSKEGSVKWKKFPGLFVSVILLMCAWLFSLSLA